MRVQQHDFVGFLAGNLVGVTKPKHVFRVLATVVVPHAGLADHERLETLIAQAAQHVDGRNVGVVLGAAFVLAVCEDGRGNAANLVIRQG
ncbi:hypothetical protein WT56_19215 [Burkholderia pseudomultivorans]|uniref:Uncharacterized protein n=1 Tax=Burkholderia pseudomultivorans TaxID=1207504 RepID=A0A132EEG0_9BURK|nr:hypothetical protein WT56_19215 [Burkholderia pseudomultivorans]